MSHFDEDEKTRIREDKMIASHWLTVKGNKS